MVLSILGRPRESSIVSFQPIKYFILRDKSRPFIGLTHQWCLTRRVNIAPVFMVFSSSSPQLVTLGSTLKIDTLCYFLSYKSSCVFSLPLLMLQKNTKILFAVVSSWTVLFQGKVRTYGLRQMDYLTQYLVCIDIYFFLNKRKTWGAIFFYVMFSQSPTVFLTGNTWFCISFTWTHFPFSSWVCANFLIIVKE